MPPLGLGPLKSNPNPNQVNRKVSIALCHMSEIVMWQSYRVKRKKMVSHASYTQEPGNKQRGHGER